MPLCEGCKADDHHGHRGQFTIGWPRADRYSRRVHGHRTATCECWRCTGMEHNPYEPLPSLRHGPSMEYYRAAWTRVFGVSGPKTADLIAQYDERHKPAEVSDGKD